MLNISAAKIGDSKLHAVEHFLLSIVQGGMKSFCWSPDADRVTLMNYENVFHHAERAEWVRRLN